MAGKSPASRKAAVAVGMLHLPSAPGRAETGSGVVRNADALAVGGDDRNVDKAVAPLQLVSPGFGVKQGPDLSLIHI